MFYPCFHILGKNVPVLVEFTENIFVSDHPLFCKDALFGSNGAWLAAHFFYYQQVFFEAVVVSSSMFGATSLSQQKKILIFLFLFGKSLPIFAPQMLKREAFAMKLQILKILLLIGFAWPARYAFYKTFF
jgi:hypothetical protein